MKPLEITCRNCGALTTIDVQAQAAILAKLRRPGDYHTIECPCQRNTFIVTAQVRRSVSC